jgi:hypothetical protein
VALGPVRRVKRIDFWISRRLRLDIKKLGQQVASPGAKAPEPLLAIAFL